MAQIKLGKLPIDLERKILEEQNRTGQSLASIARLALVDRYAKKKQS